MSIKCDDILLLVYDDHPDGDWCLRGPVRRQEYSVVVAGPRSESIPSVSFARLSNVITIINNTQYMLLCLCGQKWFVVRWIWRFPILVKCGEMLEFVYFYTNEMHCNNGEPEECQIKPFANRWYTLYFVCNQWLFGLQQKLWFDWITQNECLFWETVHTERNLRGNCNDICASIKWHSDSKHIKNADEHV